METDMHHSVRGTRPLADTVGLHLYGCRPKLKWKPLRGLMDALLNGSEETDGRMYSLTEEDRMIEKSRNAREWGGEGWWLILGASVHLSVLQWVLDRCSLRPETNQCWSLLFLFVVVLYLPCYLGFMTHSLWIKGFAGTQICFFIKAKCVRIVLKKTYYQQKVLEVMKVLVMINWPFY